MAITLHLLSSFFVTIGFSFALPVTNPSVHERAWEDCAANTTFYVCQSNGFNGCCSTDPCHLSYCPDSNKPVPDLHPPPGRIGSPECSVGMHTLFQPTLHAIFSSYPDIAYTESNISVYNHGLTSKNQVALFNGIPDRAKNCMLHWSAPHGKPFHVTGIGYTPVIALNATLPASVTWKSVQGTEGKKIGGADFAFWPEDNSTVTDHTVGNLDCAAEVAFRFGIGVNGTDEGSIDLVQDAETGWNIQYEC